MALVAYDYSSNSENEEEDSEVASTVIIPLKKDNEPPAPPTSDSTFQNGASESPDLPRENDGSSISMLLSDLPTTKSQHVIVIEDKLEDFIPKYQPPREKGQKVKITIPSLSQFDDDDEEPTAKKTKTSPKGSSLLSLLPPVRGEPLTATSFIPNILKNKQQPEKPTSTTSLVPNTVRKRAELAKKAAIQKITKKPSAGSDIESDDDIEMPEAFDEEVWKKVCGRPISKKTIQIVPEEEATPVQEINSAPPSVKPYDGLDNKAFKELVGKSKRPVNIKLIDINEEEILSDKDLWLTKSITDPEQAPKPAIENPVDPTRKKKHHITYLAEQAKANEQELQSQWSSNKHSRNMTRAKYGF